MTHSRSTKKAGTLAFLLTALLLVPQLGHCFYNPSAGRWLSRDPAGTKGGPQLYAFCKNATPTAIDGIGLYPRDTYEGLAQCACTCIAVEVTLNPPGDVLKFEWYDLPNYHEKFGNRIHVHWIVTGNPWKCKYYQDEGGTKTWLDDIPNTQGVNGTEVLHDYTDFMGKEFNPGEYGKHHMKIQWSVTFRCVSSGQSGPVRTKHLDMTGEADLDAPHTPLNW